ncbi:MAG: PAC2 family protein [Candidatus Micrarchaeota archaeon]
MSEPNFLESFVSVKTKVKAKNALLVVGLPGVGLVSKMAVDHLVRETKAEPFATLYSPHFPNQVLALKSGKLRLFSIKFYFKRFKKRDVIFLRGDLQPLTVEGQYEVCAKSLEFVKACGASEVFAMAGFATQGKKDKPNVFCSSSSKALFEDYLKLGAKQNNVIVPIVGMAGMLPALSKLFGMQGACLLVETPGNAFDAQGAKTLISILEKKTGEKFDVKKIDANVAKAEKMLSRMEAQHAQQQSPTLAPPAIPETPGKDALRYIR